MVEITTVNDVVQLQKVKCRYDETQRQYGRRCQCCQRKFLKGQIRYQWRLLIPFSKPYVHHWGTWKQRNAMFWTCHCEGCFKLTSKAWENRLSSLAKA